MKVPNIKQPIRAIGSKIKNLRIEKHQEEINKYINIEAGQSNDAYSQIFTAQEMLANYAKAKNVRIKIGDTPTSDGKLINIEVLKQDKNIGKVESINADTTLVLQAEKSNPRFLKNHDGLDYRFHGKLTSEDTFLKNLYRVVENLTNSVLK